MVIPLMLILITLIGQRHVVFRMPVSVVLLSLPLRVLPGFVPRLPAAAVPVAVLFRLILGVAILCCFCFVAVVTREGTETGKKIQIVVFDTILVQI